jgi:uridine phosphorylase
MGKSMPDYDAVAPILQSSGTGRALIEPSEQIKPIDIPKACVISFFMNEINRLHQAGKAKKLKRLKSELGGHIVYKMETDGEAVALFHPGVGGPLAAGLFEEVIAMGCDRFVVCGGCGVLDASMEAGKLLVVEAALRDEGTSYHYLPPAQDVCPSESAVRAIEDSLREEGLDFLRVKTWTTDAFFRETPAKIELRKSQGCRVVEMEAASLFAVARFRNVQIGQILYAGDDLSGEKWQSRGWSKQKELRGALIQMAARAVLRIRPEQENY